jgi:ferrous iron transport protein B
LEKNLLNKSLKVALVGQPNVGKSTVFNHLTGLNQHVGNWPGKTIEQKTGTVHLEDDEIFLVDLPGTYSLTANSEEERIARDFIIKEKPDIVLLLVNAAALERSLYLLSEVLILKVPVIIGLNMLDVAEQNNIKIDVRMLEAALKVPVVPLVATKNIGLKELLSKVTEFIKDIDSYSPMVPVIKETHREILDKVTILANGKIPEPYLKEWAAIKLLEGDKEITELAEKWLKEDWHKVHGVLAEHEDAYLDIVGGRYDWISKVIRAAVQKPKAQVISVTDRIDKYATNPITGIFILLALLFMVFFFTYTFASPLTHILEGGVDRIQGTAKELLSFLPPMFSGLIADGFLGGAGMVIAFLPTLIIFFFFIGFLEDVGYLSRIAYVMDSFMHKMGLHGKSFIPFFLGFGCNVPAILGSRIIDEKKGRKLTILLAPFVPCTARIAVVAFLAPAFFGKKAALAMVSLILLNIFVLFFAGLLISRFIFKGEKGAFIMELPLYHKPNFKTVSLYVYNNVKNFLLKAATIIVIVSGLIWLLSNYPSGKMEESCLATFGKTIEPIGAFMGFPDWKLSVALITSVVAKENTIATLGILYGSSPEHGLAERVSSVLSIPSAFAFLVIQMLFIPCLASLASIRQEAGWKWTFVSIALLLFVSMICGAAAYQVLRLFYA